MAETTLPAWPPLPELPTRLAHTLDSLEQQVGGRAALIQVLSCAPPSKPLNYLLRMLADPMSDRLPLSAVCSRAHLAPHSVLEAYRAAALARAHVLAAHQIGLHLPAVATEVVRQAATHLEICERCLGAQEILPDPTPQLPEPKPVACPACRGKGQQLVVPSLDQQKLALEVGGLLQKGGGGVSVQVSQQQVTKVSEMSGSGLLNLLMGVADQVLDPLESPHPPPDIEVVGEEDEPPQELEG